MTAKKNLVPALTKECRSCHRIGTRQFLPAGGEQWICANDRACYERIRNKQHKKDDKEQ